MGWRLILFLVCATVASVPVAVADGLGTRIASVGEWSVYRSIDAMTDEVSCVAALGSRSQVQLTPDSFAVSYSGRGGLRGYKIRLDDAPAWNLELPTDTERRIGAFVLEGRKFDQIINSRRIRVQALTVLSTVVDDDIDMSRSAELLGILRGTQCTSPK